MAVAGLATIVLLLSCSQELFISPDLQIFLILSICNRDNDKVIMAGVQATVEQSNSFNRAALNH